MAKKKKPGSGLIEQTKARALVRSKTRLGELLTLIRRRATTIIESFYDIGEALREILENKLYGVAGHKSLAELLKAEGLMSFRQASKLVAVVRKVPRDQALALGQERAYALVAYTDATPEADSPKTVLDSGAKIGDKPATEASSRDFLAAAREARAKAKASRPKTPKQRAKEQADRDLIKGLRAFLRDAGAGRAEITIDDASVRITLARATAKRLAAGPARS